MSWQQRASTSIQAWTGKHYVLHILTRGVSNSLTPIHKVLIANRGEIACRILRTSKKMGIQSVAVFSDPDRNALHVKQADEAYHIGPASSAESYLRMDKILDVAKRSGANAVHPGYGFLSENTEFADLCQKEGIIFMGPPSSAIRDMGIKNTAKRIMVDAGVPVVEGYHGDEQSDDRLSQEAEKIGYPVMLKAVRGGGGKGMRIALNKEEFNTQLDSARREAMKSFGNDDMIVEKFVVNPRHVEVQVFGDKHGNHVYLYERDCSVQRRHQKIIEEAPAPGISEETRRSIGEAAVKAAAAVNYVGAGTVEFIMDPQEKFYFMEMNTRLQVEHPVTEMITNTDLVEWQFRVAQGEPLPISNQEEIKRVGHSAEARIYAENPDNNFMPGAGQLLHLRSMEPVPSYLRVETGVNEGDEVSVHYDPMISKLVVWGPDRDSALKRLDRVLSQYHVVGLDTNVRFLRSLINHKEFQLGKVYTEFIPDHYDQLFPTKSEPTPSVVAQAVAALLIHRENKVSSQGHFNSNDPFSSSDNQFFRINLLHSEKLQLQLGSTESDDSKSNGSSQLTVQLLCQDDGSFSVTCNGIETNFKLQSQSTESGPPQVFHFECDFGSSINKCKAVWVGNTVSLFTQDSSFEFFVPPPEWLKETGGSGTVAGGSIAPMPGVVEKVMVGVGDEVQPGQAMVVMVAMKMEYVIKAPRHGKISQVMCKQGDNVAKHAILVKLEEEEPTDDLSEESKIAS